MVSSKNLNRIERKSILLFLFYSFLIAWGTEAVLILLYHFQLIGGSAAQILHFAVIGLWLRHMQRLSLRENIAVLL